MNKNPEALDSSEGLKLIQLAQPGEISGNREVCPGTTETYSINPVTDATGYTWILPTGLTITNGENTNSITVSIANTAPTGQVNIKVFAYNDSETSQDRQKNIDIKQLSVAPTKIRFDNTDYYGSIICINHTGSNNNINLNVSGGVLGDNARPRWYEGSCNGTFIREGNDLGVSINEGESKTYYVNYQGSCNTTECITVTVSRGGSVGNAIGAITGQQDVCKDAKNITYTVPAVTNAANYTWTLPSGATPTTGTLVTTTNSITVDYTSASSGNVTVVANGAGSCGGNTIQSSLAVNVKDVPSAPNFITPVSDICYGTTQTYTVSNILDATSYNWTLPTGATIVSGAGTNVITVNFNNAISGAITVEAVNACGTGATTSLPISFNTVPGNPTYITGPTVVCPGETMVEYTIPSLPNTTSYNWTISNGSASFNGVSNTNAIALDISNTPLADFKISVVGVNDCGESLIASQLTINSNEASIAPTTITSSNSNTICEGTSTSLNVSGGTLGTGATIEWYTDSCGGTSAGSGNNLVVSPTVTTTYYARYNGDCNTTTCASLTINVDPLPLAAGIITGTNVVCQGETNVKYSVPTITNATDYIWTLPTGASIISGTGTNTIEVNYDISTSISGNITVQGQNDCGKGIVSSNYSVTVNPEPVISVSQPSQTICSDGSISPISISNDNSVTGISYTWTRNNTSNLTGISASGSGTPISGTLTNNTGTVQTTTFTITATANGCTSETTATVTVNPEPVISVNQPSQTICSDGSISPISISNDNSVSGISYTWTRNNSSNLTGISVSGSGTPISGTLTNNTGTVQTTTFTITATANGCISETTATVTVNPEPVISVNQPSQTICSDGSISPITISNDNSVNGISYTWTRNNSSNLTGISASGSGTPISGTLTNNTGTVQTTTFTITATANGCTSETTATVTVNPEPVISVNQPSQTICSDGSISPITISNDNSVSGISYTWTRNNTTNLTGLSASGSGTPISGTLTNNTGTVQTTTFTIIATANGCTSETTATVTVNPEPVISVNQPSQTICSDGSISPITISNDNSVTGISYTWTRNNTSNLTGISASGSGTPISGTLTNNTGTVQTTTFTITATANGCTSETMATVTVNPKPKLIVDPSTTYTNVMCSDEITEITIIDDNNVDKTLTYAWSRNNTSNVTGTATGNSNTINVSLTNTSNTPQTTTFTITANSEYSCISEPLTVEVTVNPTPTVSATNTLQDICFGEDISPIVISNPNNISGVTYSWTRNNTTGITGLENGSGNTISGALVNTTNTPQTTTFTIIASANSCASEITTATITVYPQLVISINPDSRPNLNEVVCSDNEITPIAILNDNNLENVEYYWERTDNINTVQGMESGTGSSISGILTSTHNNNRIIKFKAWAVANGCESNVIENIRIRVKPTPKIEVSPTEQTVCDGSTFSMAFSNTYNTNNTTYSWTRNNTSNVSGVASSGSGSSISGTLTNTTSETQTVTFTVTATRQGCSTTTTATVEVYAPLSTPVIGETQDVCYGEDPTPLYLVTEITGGSGNYSYEWQVSENENNGFSTVGTGTSYSPPRSERYYRLRVYDNACNSTIKTSNTVIINYSGLGGIFDSPKITNRPSSTSIYCPGDEISPRISIGHSFASDVDYSWSSNAAYFTPATGTDNGTRVNTGWISRETYATIRATLKNNGNSTVSTSFYITPIFTNFTTCNSDLIELPIKIYPTPKIESVTSEETTICSGSSPDLIVDGNITDNPMEFSWTRTTPSGVTGITSGNSGSIAANSTFTLSNMLTNTTSSPITVTYTITPKSTTGCSSGTPVTYNIIVQPFIEAAASLVSTIDSCDDTTVTLQANSNISGKWTALPLGGVFSDITDPNATFTGESGTDYTLTWTVINEGLCGESSTTVAVNIPACSGNDFDFNGTNTSVNFGNAYNLNGPFSIEIWAKPNSTSGQQTIFSKRSATNSSSGYDLTLSNGNTVKFNWNNGNSISASGLSTSRWYHIAITYNGSAYKLYIDGVLKASQNGDGPQSNTSLALLGAVQSSLLPTNYFNGWLDELRIWNTALTAEQIQEMMNQEIQNNGGNVRGSVIPVDITGSLDWNLNLVGYYQMGSNINNGTLASANGSTSGVLRNMTSTQEETAPLPYQSNGNSNWDSAAAWMNADVNQLPNSNGITWNIVKIKNNVTLDKPTTVLGLIVENNTLTVPDNTPLYVSKYLKLDGNLKLEGEAQLLQSENSMVDYTGTGGLFRDQEGTTNIYNYNYWASPVSTTGTENNRTYKLSEVLHVGTTPVGWTSNLDGAAGNPPYISTRWLYLFEDYNAEIFNWHRIDEDYNISVGLGYIMKGASNADYTFIGQPNNGDYLVNVSAGNDALVGNPYPSAIDANAFIIDNRNMLDDGGNNGEIRFWRQSTTNNTHVAKEYLGGYASLNLTGGNPAVAPDDISGAGDANSYIPKRYIPVAQGFFITAGQTGQIEFNNSQRIFKTEASGSSAFLRTNKTTEENTNDVQRVRINFKNPDKATRQLLLGFTPDNAATDAVDFGYDATNFETLSSDMLFLINDNTYVIQGVGEFDETKHYPLAMFIGKDGNIEISLKALENFDTPIDVFIYDSYTDTYTQINNSKYQMHLEKGDYLDRYFVAFKEESRLDVIENELNKITINYLNNSDEIHIKTPNHLNIKQVSLINTLGQTIKVWNTTNATLSNNCKIPVRHASEGNYIIKVNTEKGSTTKKISIKY
ncbi:PKD-like domain-containing protein [uncultured Formosa sp.]|uniref:PKD-like domain-containing protein n=1 Tax=uncultured Formosa sp. TaxID=255435 RepID=UPI00263366AE|nr:PKD-like domain-containing protein [uncultured Formosa sp.]